MRECNEMHDTNDKVAKDFEAFPDVAADIINVWQHQGKQVMQKEWMLPAPTETFYQGQDALHNQLEDVAKYEMVDGKINAMYLFANQTKVDEGMLLRKASYVGGVYREQYGGKIPEACPVMELVLYWNSERWKGSRSMKELFQDKKIPLETWQYIDDLKLHMWEMRYLPKEVREQFTSDMRIVVDYLAEGNSYSSHQKVVHKEALIKMIRVLSGDKDVSDTKEMLEKMNVKEEDEIDVCEFLGQYIRLGRQEGIKEELTRGIQILITACKEVGATFEETVVQLKEKYLLEEDEAQENMKLYW